MMEAGFLLHGLGCALKSARWWRWPESFATLLPTSRLNFRETQVRQQKSKMIRTRFTALPIITISLRVMAFLQMLSVLLLIFVVKSQVPDAIMRQGQNFRLFSVGAGVTFVASLIVWIGLLAVAELLTCFMAFEENTRQGGNAVVNLQAVVRTSIEQQTQILVRSLTPRSVAQTASLGSCPKCGQSFRVTENLRGQQVACPKCSARFVV